MPKPNVVLKSLQVATLKVANIHITRTCQIYFGVMLKYCTDLQLGCRFIRLV